jgi:hypothetical protein
LLFMGLVAIFSIPATVIAILRSWYETILWNRKWEIVLWWLF